MQSDPELCVVNLCSWTCYGPGSRMWCTTCSTGRRGATPAWWYWPSPTPWTCQRGSWSTEWPADWWGSSAVPSSGNMGKYRHLLVTEIFPLCSRRSSQLVKTEQNENKTVKLKINHGTKRRKANLTVEILNKYKYKYKMFPFLVTMFCNLNHTGNCTSSRNPRSNLSSSSDP